MTVHFEKADLQARVFAAIKVARGVGRNAAAFRASAAPEALHIENKGLQDFVTVADRQAEEMIRAALLGAFPADAFMGEEGGGAPGEGGAWVVDPIDGTTNFIRGFRHWAVSIAFIADGHILAGVIYDAAQDAVFHAIAGEGACKDGVPVRVSSNDDPARGMAMLGHSRRTSFEDYLDTSRRLHALGVDYRRMGAAALGLVRVAEGVADVYFEKHLSAWDMLAGLLIAKEAGALVYTKPLTELLSKGGPVAVMAPGLAPAFSFLIEDAAMA